MRKVQLAKLKPLTKRLRQAAKLENYAVKEFQLKITFALKSFELLVGRGLLKIISLLMTLQ